ncbi:hypothetical protein OAP14_11170 [Aliiglaciecola sp.]|nr:hypothetical protein [Aliiglaciecola sp.]
MEIINELVRLFVPYIVFVAILVVFWLLYKSAKRWRGVAFAFGMLVQIFLPDPKVEQTIQMVVEEKRAKKQSAGQGDKNHLN